MQAALSLENHVKGFPQLIPSPQKSSVLTTFLPYQNSPGPRGFSDTPIYLRSFHTEKVIVFNFMLQMFLLEFGTQ